MSFKTISVIGLGYIGLPTAAMFASHKVKVIGVDVNKETVDTINRGEIHIVEPDLDMLVKAAVNQGYLISTLTAESADAFLIAVPTPFLPIENKGDIPQPDLKYIKAATKSIAPVLKKGDLVILESTSPVGATEKMADWLAEARSDLTFPKTHNEESDIRIAHCPERVLPGQVVRELVENDRVIGGLTAKCSEQAVALYKTFVRGDCVITNARTAEMAKLTENSCRDVQIAFANELSIICDKLDIDVWELISLANRHPRINILQPGPGVGGHCIAVDPWFIVDSAPKEAKLVRLAREINDEKSNFIIRKAMDRIDKMSTPVIACFGATFKPDIDDLRESSALKIIRRIAVESRSRILVVEPNIKDNLNSLNLPDNIKFVSVEQAIKEADFGILLVAHKEFRYFGRLNFDKIDMIYAVDI